MTNPFNLQYRAALTPDDIAGAKAVRRAVFVEEQGVPESIEMDEMDGMATHLVAVDPSGVVGTARVFESEGEWHIGRAAVLLIWRRNGIGSQLMALAVDYARQHGAQTIVLHSQVPVVPFYEQLGFVAEGATFLEADIPHLEMRLQLI